MPGRSSARALEPRGGLLARLGTPLAGRRRGRGKDALRPKSCVRRGGTDRARLQQPLSAFLLRSTPSDFLPSVVLPHSLSSFAGTGRFRPFLPICALPSSFLAAFMVNRPDMSDLRRISTVPTVGSVTFVPDDGDKLGPLAGDDRSRCQSRLPATRTSVATALTAPHSPCTDRNSDASLLEKCMAAASRTSMVSQRVWLTELLCAQPVSAGASAARTTRPSLWRTAASPTRLRSGS